MKDKEKTNPKNHPKILESRLLKHIKIDTKLMILFEIGVWFGGGEWGCGCMYMKILKGRVVNNNHPKIRPTFIS